MGDLGGILWGGSGESGGLSGEARRLLGIPLRYNWIPYTVLDLEQFFEYPSPLSVRL